MPDMGKHAQRVDQQNSADGMGIGVHDAGITAVSLVGFSHQGAQCSGINVVLWVNLPNSEFIVCYHRYLDELSHTVA